MDGYDHAGLRRLDPPPGGDWASDSQARWRAVERRDAGLRQTRRFSGWTAAALVAGVAAGAGYFAHVVPPAAVSTSGTTVQGTAGSTAQKPSLTHPVVTSGGSGVTAGASVSSPGSGSTTAQWRDN